MNQVDFSTYKFRCSGLKNLMVNPKKGSSELLSETTKTYLEELWIDAVFGRRKVITSGPMEKGTIVESDTISLVEQVTGQVYFKNNDEFSNEYIKGTPDIRDIPNACVKDTKSSWDMWTFAKVTEEKARKDYFYQILGYMWLCDASCGDLLYGLVNTPEHIMYGEVNKLSYRMTPEEAEAVIRQNHTFDDVPLEMRLKQFHFERQDEEIEKLKVRVELSREYMKGLTL